MKKQLLGILCSFVIIFGCTKQQMIEKQPDQKSPVETLRKKVNDLPSFCTSSCSNFIGYISESGGSEGATSWSNFHLWISEPLSYDVIITIDTKFGGTSTFMQYGQQFYLPAGQNNTSTISGYQDASFLCSGNESTSVQKTNNGTVYIISIDRVDNQQNLNSQYQLYPGSGPMNISSFCIGNGGGGKDGGGSGL